MATGMPDDIDVPIDATEVTVGVIDVSDVSIDITDILMFQLM